MIALTHCKYFLSLAARNAIATLLTFDWLRDKEQPLNLKGKMQFLGSFQACHDSFCARICFRFVERKCLNTCGLKIAWNADCKISLPRWKLWNFLLKRWHNLVPNHIKLGTTVLWWRLNIFERGILGVLFGKCRSCTKHFAYTFLSFVGMSLFIAVLLMIFTSHSVGILEALFSRQIKSS